MKNRDLIQKLLLYNWDADVNLTNGEEITVSYSTHNNSTELTTKQIFIEPADICYECEHDEDPYCNAYDCLQDEVAECYQFIRKE